MVGSFGLNPKTRLREALEVTIMSCRSPFNVKVQQPRNDLSRGQDIIPLQNPMFILETALLSILLMVADMTRSVIWPGCGANGSTSH